MSCCGKNRAQIAQTPAASPKLGTPQLQRRLLAPNDHAFVTVEYRGKGRLVVVGPITGRSYVFAKTGERVTMDARDRELARTFVNLRLVPKT